jgi:DNA-binding NtrC family response regulator
MARILLVDDAVDLRNALAHALQSEGHVVAAADDGEQGAAMQPGFGAEILITDIFMPNKDGIETIQEFKQSSPGTRIVVMSASNRLNSATYLTIAQSWGWTWCCKSHSASRSCSTSWRSSRLRRAEGRATGADPALRRRR